MENNISRTEVKKGKFNIIDVLVIVIILLLALGAMWMLDPLGLFPNESVKDVMISYTVEIKDVDSDFLQLISEDQSVIDTTTGNSIGTVRDVSSAGSYVWKYSDESGEMIKVAIEGRVDITITVEADSTYESGVGYSAGGVRIAYGTPISVRTSSFFGSGYCTSVKEIG